MLDHFGALNLAIEELIVKTVQSGSANCSFEAYVISVEETDTAAKELPGSRWEQTTTI
jgi:hypothetical protein